MPCLQDRLMKGLCKLGEWFLSVALSALEDKWKTGSTALAPCRGIAAELKAAELPAMATGVSLNRVPPWSKLQWHQHCNKHRSSLSSLTRKEHESEKSHHSSHVQLWCPLLHQACTCTRASFTTVVICFKRDNKKALT